MTSKFCIRDDDTSYFTSPRELISSWGWWDYNITLGVIPLSAELLPLDLPNREFKFHQLGQSESPISNNIDLCDFLNNNTRKYTIAMHGCTHRYRVSGRNLIAEFASKDVDFLQKNIQRGLAEFEKCGFNRPRIFIPPDNSASFEALDILHRNGFEYIQIPFPIVPESIKWFSAYHQSASHWLGRALNRIIFNSIDLRVCGQASRSIGASILVKFSDEKRLFKRLDFALERNWPITLSTHYWELQNKEYKGKFIRMVEYLFRKGASPASMEDLFCVRN